MLKGKTKKTVSLFGFLKGISNVKRKREDKRRGSQKPRKTSRFFLFDVLPQSINAVRRKRRTSEKKKEKWKQNFPANDNERRASVSSQFPTFMETTCVSVLPDFPCQLLFIEQCESGDNSHSKSSKFTCFFPLSSPLLIFCFRPRNSPFTHIYTRCAHVTRTHTDTHTDTHTRTHTHTHAHTQ